MKSILALVAIVGAHGTILDKLDKMCDLFGQMGAGQQDFTPEEMQKVFGNFASLFADKVDCSEDPFNPVLGYNLKGATFVECQKKKEEQLTNANTQFQLKEFKCIEKIADEDQKTGAMWLEMSNTGKFKPEFSARVAIRVHFNDDGLATAYHGVYDSYHVMNKGSGSAIKKSLDDVCDVFKDMSADQQTISKDEMEKIGARFAGLFAEKVDCSEDPFNGKIGYNIHGGAFGDCMAAKKDALSQPGVKFQLGNTKCLEKIADAEDSTGALWLEMSNTGAFKAAFSVRAAVRYHFDGDGKITAYHAVYDSYHLLGGDDSRLESAVTISELSKTTTLPAIALTAMAIISAFVLGALFGRRDQKRYAALKPEEA